MTKINLNITGMMCANCVRTVERTLLKKTPGIIAANVNYATESASVEFDSKQVSVAEIVAAIKRAGYGVVVDKPAETNDIANNNKVKLPYNRCGGVYGLDLGTDETIGSDFVAKNMYGVVMGKMTQAYDENSSIPAYEEPFASNKCDLDGIANPDNISFIPGYQTLIIGEDTGSGHQNDMIWSYNLKTKKLTRIQTTPYGSETTSPYMYKNINGFGYLMSVIQHPYGESDEDKLTDDKQALSYTSYIGPFPALN